MVITESGEHQLNLKLLVYQSIIPNSWVVAQWEDGKQYEMVNQVCACVYICFMCMCAYLAATVCANTCLSVGVSVWLALCLLAIMSSTLVVRGIPVIARVPWASSPRCITDRVTRPKWQQLLDWQSTIGESHTKKFNTLTCSCSYLL